MIEPYVRPTYQRLCGDWLARQIGKFFSPTGVTLLAILSGMLILPALAFNLPLFALGLLLLTGLCDTLDGTLARLTKKDSAFGAAFDIVGDRVVEVAIILGLFFVNPEERALGCLLMMGSILLCVTTFLVVGIFTANTSSKSFHYSPGLMERPEAFLFFGVQILFPSSFESLAYLFSFLVCLTAVIRMGEFWYANKSCFDEKHEAK